MQIEKRKTEDENAEDESLWKVNFVAKIQIANCFVFRLVSTTTEH